MLLLLMFVFILVMYVGKIVHVAFVYAWLHVLHMLA